MDTRDNSTKPSEVAEQAAEWFIRLKDGRLSAADERDYLRWLKQSPMHIAEMLRVSRVFGVLYHADLKAIQPQMPDEVSAETNIVKLPTDDRLGLRSPPPTRRKAWQTTSARAAAVAVLAIGVSVMVMQGLNKAHTIETAPGEWRQLSLDDNSVVKVGPRTELSVDFNDTQRTVKLAGGEAAFQVSKDSNRPFVVVVGDTRVQAIGTAFGVTREREAVVVTVSEGKVAVTHGSARQSLPLIAGEQVRVLAAATQLPQAKRVNVAQELAWVERRVIFEDAVVADAVREFNRRNRTQIRVDAPQLEHMPVRAMFNAGDPESFAAFLATASGARVVREDKDLLVLKANGP